MTPSGISRYRLTGSLVLALATSACCTRKDCDTNGIVQVELNGFREDEIDTLIFRRYDPSASGGALLDSFIYTGRNTVLTLGNDARSGGGFQEYDYRIEVPELERTYLLTGFEMRAEGCNTCFPWRPKGDYYQVLSSYELDGQRKAGAVIQIDR